MVGLPGLHDGGDPTYGAPPSLLPSFGLTPLDPLRSVLRLLSCFCNHLPFLLCLVPDDPVLLSLLGFLCEHVHNLVFERRPSFKLNVIQILILPLNAPIHRKPNSRSLASDSDRHPKWIRGIQLFHDTKKSSLVVVNFHRGPDGSM